MSNELFRPIFVPETALRAVSDEAWLQALLDVEAALAVAEERAGVIPEGFAAQIRSACRAEFFNASELGRAARSSGNVVVPLVHGLREKVSDDAARYVHWGATSQDVLDSAAMLVSRRALEIILTDLDRIASACAHLAEEHVGTIMPGRTLLQQALPTTFGLKAAGWLVAVLDARRHLVACRSELVAELGGAAGSLASLGNDGPAVLRFFAEELDLSEPVVPWHTARTKVAGLAAALSITAGAVAKAALDVVLMSQTEVAEVAEPAGEGRGASSTMPHKRNPIGATVARACAQRVQGLTATLLAAMEQEHERAAGSWHVEWEALGDALALTAGELAWMGDVLEGLRVFPDRMRKNLELTGGLVLAERVSLLLAERVGSDAHQLVAKATQRATEAGRSLREELQADSDITAHLTTEEIDEALDPETYLGSSDVFVQRALEHYRHEIQT